MCIAGCETIVRAALSRRGFFASAAGFAATAQLPAAAAEPKPEAVMRSFTKVVDLTHTMSPQFPTFSGKPGIAMHRMFTFKKDQFNLFTWNLDEHTGTHLDAPLHFSEHGASTDQLPIDQLVVPLAVVNIVYQAAQRADYQLSRDDLAKWEAEHGRLPAGCCVAMHSGWGALATTDPGRFDGRDVGGTFHFPGFAPEAAEWLLHERQVAGIAVRHPVARPWSVAGFHDPSNMVAGRPLGAGKRRQSRPGAGVRRDLGCGRIQSKRRDRRTCSGHRTGVILEGEPSAKQRKSGRRPDSPSASGVRGAAHARRTVSRANPILRLPPLFGVAAIMQTRGAAI